jgi:hypothetical protein
MQYLLRIQVSMFGNEQCRYGGCIKTINCMQNGRMLQPTATTMNICIRLGKREIRIRVHIQASPAGQLHAHILLARFRCCEIYPATHSLYVVHGIECSAACTQKKRREEEEASAVRDGGATHRRGSGCAAPTHCRRCWRWRRARATRLCRPPCTRTRTARRGGTPAAAGSSAISINKTLLLLALLARAGGEVAPAVRGSRYGFI